MRVCLHVARREVLLYVGTGSERGGRGASGVWVDSAEDPVPKRGVGGGVGGGPKMGFPGRGGPKWPVLPGSPAFRRCRVMHRLLSTCGVQAGWPSSA